MLVVDDIATNRLVAATYLRLLGAIPVEVASGAEALARLAGPALPDLILLDLLMPGMDGRETLRRIRNLGGTASSLPVVAMSADSSAQLRPGSGDPHFDGAISKPISGERLAKVLMPLVGRNAAADKDSVPL